MYATSETFGNVQLGYEIGKKENRKGGGGTSTLGEYLKVIKHHAVFHFWYISIFHSATKQKTSTWWMTYLMRCSKSGWCHIVYCVVATLSTLPCALCGKLSTLYEFVDELLSKNQNCNFLPY